MSTRSNAKIGTDVECGEEFRLYISSNLDIAIKVSNFIQSIIRN